MAQASVVELSADPSVELITSTARRRREISLVDDSAIDSVDASSFESWTIFSVDISKLLTREDSVEASSSIDLLLRANLEIERRRRPTNPCGGTVVVTP